MRIHLRKIKGSYLRSRYFLVAVLLAVASFLGNISSDPVHAAVGTVTEYTLPTSGAYLEDIALGPDGNIWYTANGPTINKRVGKLTVSGGFTEYPNPVVGGRSVRAITTGSDDNIWYSEQTNTTGVNRIVNITPTGTVLSSYTLLGSSVPMNMTPGPDGAVWFTLGSNKIGKITTSGLITDYVINVGGVTADITDITAGPDGNLWFTAGHTGHTIGNAIGKITTSGTYTIYPISTYNANPHSITTGSDGNLWFTELGVQKVGKITTSGVITEYTAPASSRSITAGSDGALWFTEGYKIGRVTTSGIFTEYSVPGASSGGILEHIITGPDGAVWFTDGVTKIGRMATELTNQTVSFTSTVPASAVVDGATYTPTASATSGLPVAVTVDSSSSGVCSIDGSGVVSFQSAGTCTLNANQSGNVDYNPAPQVQQSFTVHPVDADTSVALNCPTTANIGATVTCTIIIANDGPAAARNASLTALFSDSFSGTSLSGGGTLSGQYITWTTPSLSSGASVTLTFNATASVAGKARFNAALLQTSPDPNNSDNIVDSTIAIH